MARSRNHIHGNEDGVECPDCGQHFDSAFVSSDYDDFVFKKPSPPTIFTRVVRRILHPFGDTDSDRDVMSSPMSNNAGPHGHHQHHTPKIRRNHKRQYEHIGTESAYGASTLVSHSLSWKRHQADDSCRQRDHLNQSLKSDSHAASRTPFDDMTSLFNYAGDQRGRKVESNSPSDSCSIIEYSDRLNLGKYLQPQRPPLHAVQAWVNDLENVDPVDSLLTPDLSCDCKNGITAAKDELVNQFLMETCAKFQHLKQSVEAIKPPNGDLSVRGSKSSQQIKSLVAECSQAELRVSEFLEKLS